MYEGKLYQGVNQLNTISLCMIVKDEEDVIARCLESIHQVVDEIIIVDTGSTDHTKEICQTYTDKVFDFEWIDDFAAARNFAFSFATMDYIFWMDADDVLMEEDRVKFLALKEKLDPAVDSVTMKYNLSFDEQGNVIFNLRRNRLVKRQNNFQWQGAVHELLMVGGNIFNSDIAVTHRSIRHDSDRNLRIYESRLAKGEEFSPRDLYYFANELKDHQKYERAVYFYEKFLSTEKGWVEDNISACGKLSDCYSKLNEHKKSLDSILQSFKYDHPRPEFCCRLGWSFLEKQEFHAAVFWYKLATQIKISDDNLGFQNHSYSTWMPHLQLCVCYDRLGEFELAYQHNEEARHYQPDHASVLHNKKYLESILKVKEGEEEAHKNDNT